MNPGFTILDHPADIGIEAAGASLPEAFEYAAAGLISIILDPSTIREDEQREIILTADDREQLLVKWLGEILYWFDGKHFVTSRAAIDKFSRTNLHAILFGEPFLPARHKTKLDVKAVTYHQVFTEETVDGGKVRVYLDI